jgi:predicted metal-dependent hydrolase
VPGPVEPRSRPTSLPVEPVALPVEPAPLPVEVVRSPRRHKTVQARLVDGVVRVQVPAWMSDDEVADHTRALVAKLERRHRSDRVDLVARAAALARAHDLPQPRSVAWSDRQRSRWGSCTPATGEIRLSSRLAGFPPWVVDYVLVHELAHLLHPDHGPAFHAVVDRYPRAERARGFLIAKGMGDDLDQDDLDQDDPDLGDPDPGAPDPGAAG